MANNTTGFSTRVNENSTAVYTGTLTDQFGAVIPASAITTLTLTLCTLNGTIINSRDDQDVLNTNNVVVLESGVLTFTLQAADTAIIETKALKYETHRATFTMEFGGGSTATHDVDIIIRNLTKVT